ncbi:unnamed protein product [Sphagnum troendelagicum]|uniref:Small acidic protein-like domain-containing protein n=1 Tax=Sphagnum troendelagicum TaxID=128251 RepID=A0ABP0U6P7_9BRYO
MEGDRAFMSRKHLRSYRRRSPSTSPSTGGGNRHQSHSPSPVPREVTSKGLDQVKKGRNMDSERMGHREGDYQRRRVEDGAVEKPTASHSRSLHSDHDQSRRPLAGTSDYCEQGQSNRGTRPHSHHEHLRSDSDRLGRYDRPEQYGGGYREKDIDRGVQMFKVKERDTEREKGRDRDRVRGSDDDYLRSKDQEREPKRSRESDDRKRVDCSRDAGELIDADRPREWQEIRRRDLHRERDMVKDQSRERIMDRDRAWPRIRRDEEPTVKDQSRHRNLDKERSWSRDMRDEEGAELRKRNCRDIGGESTAASAELANDLNAAKVAALRAAELVNKNMGIAGFFSSEYKKKLLWGSKKAAVEQEPVVAAAGTNRWDTVHFSDPERQDKFQKLMGVKGDIKDAEVPPPPVGAAVFTEEKQRELQEDLERQFTQGLRRRDGRTVGLGL